LKNQPVKQPHQIDQNIIYAQRTCSRTVRNAAGHILQEDTFEFASQDPNWMEEVDQSGITASPTTWPMEWSEDGTTGEGTPLRREDKQEESSISLPRKRKRNHQIMSTMNVQQKNFAKASREQERRRTKAVLKTKVSASLRKISTKV
jgi:hypothetical protein